MAVMSLTITAASAIEAEFRSIVSMLVLEHVTAFNAIALVPWRMSQMGMLESFAAMAVAFAIFVQMVVLPNDVGAVTSGIVMIPL
jgi:hypothetical protein